MVPDQQILPPIARLCEPIEGTSVATLAERLGLDKSRFGQGGNGGDAGNEDEAWGFTPMCRMEDSERFAACEALKVRCSHCNQEADFPGVYCEALVAVAAAGESKGGVASMASGGLRSGLLCPNMSCQALYWGAPNAASCFARLFNRVTLTVRLHVKKYYDCWLLCDDTGCNRRSRQQSVVATARLARGCHGHMGMEYSEKALHTQLKFLETLFDVRRAKAKKMEAGTVPLPLPDSHVRVLDLLHEQTRQIVSSTAYNWIRPSLWSMISGGVKHTPTVEAEPRKAVATPLKCFGTYWMSISINVRCGVMRMRQVLSLSEILSDLSSGLGRVKAMAGTQFSVCTWNNEKAWAK